MKKFELSGKAYKANLHCHTTVSDGRYTPEETKKMYMEQGYSIVAFTDHNVLLDHSDLCEDSFLALNGYELDVSEPGRAFNFTRTAHMCFIAKKQDNLTQVCYNKDKYIWGNAREYIPQLRFDRDDYERVYSHEGVSDMMKKGRESGFFVTYNHPTWSIESYPEYSGYEGMDAMEIFNTGCDRGGWNEYNARCYDDLLRQGKRIYCVAADDNHSSGCHSIGTPGFDCFGGWVMIFAEKLEYNAVMKALEEGKFYCVSSFSSDGPAIEEFYVEDGWVYVKTSPVKRICYMTKYRRAELQGALEGEYITEAKFRINPDDGYFRIDIMDEFGSHANTNAIFTDEIF